MGLIDSQLTSALVPTVPSPCFIRQSTTIAKTFSCVICPYMLRDWLVVVGGRRHGLVLTWFESCVLRLVFLDSYLQSPGQEKHFGILFTPFRNVVHEIQLSVQTWWKR